MKESETLGQRTADKIAALVGSWKFIIFQSVALFFWVVLNIVAWEKQWDPYPFIFLNLVLALETAYTGPIILLSQNRMTERDHKKFEADIVTNRKAEREVEEIQKQIKNLEQKKIDKILEILNGKNHEQ